MERKHLGLTVEADQESNQKLEEGESDTKLARLGLI